MTLLCSCSLSISRFSAWIDIGSVFYRLLIEITFLLCFNTRNVEFDCFWPLKAFTHRGDKRTNGNKEASEMSASRPKRLPKHHPAGHFPRMLHHFLVKEW